MSTTCNGDHRDDLGSDVLDTLRNSCVSMALNRIEGDEALYVGG
jgi:hypothetical protein